MTNEKHWCVRFFFIRFFSTRFNVTSLEKKDSRTFILIFQIIKNTHKERNMDDKWKNTDVYVWDFVLFDFFFLERRFNVKILT